MKIIAPSILNADNMHLGNAITKAKDAGIKRFHLDIMDGHFVPNLSYGPQLVQDFKRAFPDEVAEIHLMASNLGLIPSFVKAGCDVLEFHYEAAGADTAKWLHYLQDHGVKAGLVLNPETDVQVIKPFLPELDQVLLMSVHPGFGGQSFIPATLDRLAAVKKLANLPVEVDGGVNDKTAAGAAQAGADILVAGSFIFGHQDIAGQVAQLNALIND